MQTMNKFNLKDFKIEVKYYKEKDIDLIINHGDNEETFNFENRKDFYFFINQLTDAAEEIRELEE